MPSNPTMQRLSGAVADQPVFFDPSRSRWTVVKVVSSLALVLMISLFSVLVMRVVTTPQVSVLPLSSPAQRTVVRQPEALVRGELNAADEVAAALPPAGVDNASVTTGFFPVGVQRQ